MNWPSDVSPPPRILSLPPGAESLDEAEAAIELWEHYSGKTADPSQRLVVCMMMAQQADGRWAAATTGREMPRQNGKGDEVEIVELWGLVQRGEAILHTVHDAVMLASQAQQRLLSVVENAPDLRKKVKRTWRGIGQQMIEFRNGGVIWYRTRTGGGGRGVDDIDRLIVDEAQHATEEQMAAVAPTLLANSNPQLNAMGTSAVGSLSAWWWGIRLRALAGDSGRFGYVGHTAETVTISADGVVIQEPINVEDRALWASANPALAAGRGGGMEFLEEQYRVIPTTFAREHLGVWDPPPPSKVTGWQVWSAPEWSAAASSYSGDGWLVGPVSLSIDMPPDQKCISVGVTGACVEGGIGYELIHADVRGVSQLVDVVNAAMANGASCPFLDPRSPAGSLIGPLRDAGVEVVELTTREYTSATGGMYNAVLAGEWHHRNRPELNAAVRSAARRSVGDAWLIDRRTGVDVSALTAAVVGFHAHSVPKVDAPEPGFLVL